MSVKKLETNLSVAPYNDDYNTAIDKQYVRILFVPRRSVQVRELNQMQAMQQEQIARFGSHVFKEGAVVDGVGVTYIPDQKFVYVENNTTANVQILYLDQNYLLTSNTGVRAVPRKVIPGFASQYPNSQRIYLDYVATGKDASNNDVSTFLSGETLTIYENQSKLGTLIANNIVDTINMLTQNSTVTSVTGNAYALTTTEGIIYQKGHFLKADPQYVLVNEFSANTANRTVGFTTVETIVTESGDETLNDNANGTTNVLAPGAHRLKLTPTLISVDKTQLAANTTFYPIVEFDDDKPVEDNTKNDIYNTLGDIMARGVYEESGDYVVSPFSVESLATSNISTMNYAVSPGVAVVRGHRVQFIGQKTIEVERAIEPAFGNAQIVSANYGNYVLVDELVGLFSGDNYDTVSIYDTAQNSITDVEGAGSAPSGSVVGTATVRAFVYDSGTKGTANARYRLYLTNVKMNSGKSFSSDAKSFYVDGQYGKVKADAVLVNSKAVLSDSANDRLFFPFGLGAVKRLTDSDGVNDTQFIIRDSATATMQTNGYASFSLNSPYAGGVERLNQSVGTLSDTNELQYDITLTSEAFTADLAGTVTASSNVITGTGTAFTTNFAAGEYIRVNGNIRRITAVTNATSMQLNSALTVTANVYQKYWPQGHVINTAGGSNTIQVVSNTQFSLSTNMATLSAPVTVRAVYPVHRSTASPARKAINKDRYVKIDCSTAGTGGVYNLGLVDVVGIDAVYFGTTYSESNPNRAVWFSLNNGQTSAEYGHAKLTVKPSYKSKLTSSTRLLVKLKHFTANTSTGGGFFSVDSYPIIREGESANTTNIAIADVYAIGNYDFRDVVDFRPQRYNTANSATSIATATTNPAVANSSYQITSSGTLLIAPDNNFQADVEYYLPRYDLLTMSKNGDLVVRKGEPAESPKVPINEADTMVIATVFVPAFPTLTTREFENNKRFDLGTKFEIQTNRRYTMEDIGKLDKRINRLEYYATLNALEQSARDMTVLDESGLDRFKNGIFADTFNSHLIGRTDYFEYKVSIDADEGIARPRFKKHAIDFALKTSASYNIQRTGNHISLPYTSAKFISQPHASKIRNCTQSVWKWNGKLNLFPSYDAHQDETKLPAVNATVDLAAGWEEFAETPFGTQFGEWRTTGTKTSSSSTSASTSSTSTRRISGGSVRSTATTTTTTTATTVSTTQGRNINELVVNTNTNVQNLGSYVTDVSANPYIASRLVAFTGNGFKPSTRLYAFFDDINVSAHCAPGELSGITSAVEGKEHTIVNRTGAFGAALTADAQGNVYGIFRIPDGTFRTGDRVFMLTNVDNLATGADAQISNGQARYTASSLSITTQGISLTTIEPELSVSTTVQSRTNSITTTNSSTSTLVSNTTVMDPVTQRVFVNNRRRQSEQNGDSRGGNDPIAQSFMVTLPTTTTATGMIVDKIGVFFKSKDPTLGVTVGIMEMNNGLPDSKRIIARKHLTSAQVSVSNNATSETIFDFESLAYLSRDQYYAFYVQPDGDSPEYTIWCSEVGGTDIQTGRQIFTNPYIGVMFVSANMNTWNAIQTEDLKFNLYRAKFTAQAATALFQNENDDFFTIDGLTKANSSVSISAGDVVRRVVNNVIQTSNTDPYGLVQRIDEANDQLIVDSSNGLFETGHTVQVHRPFMNGQTTLNSNTLIASANIVTIDDPLYSVVVPRFSCIVPGTTGVSIMFKGTDTNYVRDTAFKSVVAETDTELVDKDRVVVSRSNEVASMSSGKSAEYAIRLTTEDDFMSPVIDLRRKTGLFIENIINNDVANEHTIYGNALAKYVGPIVTLGEGQDAEDIELWLTAYRPSGTDVKVYIKALNGTDAAQFDDKVWTLMTMVEGSSTYGSTSNPSDYREYKFGLPSAAPVTSALFKNASNSNIAEYTDADGARYIGFKSFAIKIVMTSSTSARIPRLRDVRALALQV